MANERLIEVISPQSNEQIEKLIANLLEAHNITVKWNQSLAQNKTLLPSDVKKAYSETASAIKSTQKAVSDYEKQEKSLQNAQKKRMQATSSINKETIKLREETNKLNRESRLQAKYTSALSDVYTKLDAKLSILSNEYRNLAIRKELGVKLTEKEAKRMDFLEGKIQKYDAVLKKVDSTMGRNQRNVGNYKSTFDGLGFSIAQLTREAPAFANSMQTGFMAISNNIPMLVDEIKRLKTANVELAASGKPTVSILKRLGGAIFSWQTLISVGVTLLTVYGAKLFDWAFGMSEAEKATKKANEAIKEQNDQLRENIRLRKQQLEEVTDVINSSEIAEQFRGLLTGSIRETEKAGLALIELSERLEAAGVKNADALKNEDLLQSDRLIIGINLLEIEKQKVKLAEERLRLDAELNKKAEILKRFEDGKITAQQKSNELARLGRTGLDKTLEIQGRINQLEEQNNEIIGKTVELEKDRNKEKDTYLKNTVAFYSDLIAKTVELRDNTAQSRAEYEKFDKTILTLTYHMQLLTGEWQKLLREMQKSPEDMSNDELVKGITASTEALEKENAVLLKNAAEREKAKRDALFAEKQIEDAFVRLGETLGIQEQTTRDLFDGIVNGFNDAGDAAETFGALAIDALNALTAAQRRQTEEKIEQLEKQKEIELQFAGESAAARGAIEERYQRQVAQEKTKQAKREKTAAIISSIINTATAVVKTLAQLGFPAGIPAAAIVGALGLAQTAIIASQPIPQFKEGVTGFEGGKAIVGDGGKHEPITDKKGRLIGISPKRSTLVNLPKGSNVYKDFDTFNKELDATLRVNGINPLGNAVNSPIVVFNGNSSGGMTASEMRKVMKETLGAMPINKTVLDKNGLTTFTQKQYQKTVDLNNRVTSKGISV